MTRPIDRDRFIALLAERFPEVVAGIDECSQGLLHLEMGDFCRVTQAAIDRQDRGTVKQHFQFIDEVFRDAGPEVQNAVYVSYLEHLRLDGCLAAPTQAWELLTPRLRQALAEVDVRWRKLFATTTNPARKRRR